MSEYLHVEKPFLDQLSALGWHVTDQGQGFIPSSLRKIREVRAMIDASGRAIELQVDGGIKTSNIKEVAAAGADVFVSGSGVFSTPDYGKTIAELKRQALSGR